VSNEGGLLPQRRTYDNLLVGGATQRPHATAGAHVSLWTLLKWERPSHTYLTNRLPGKSLFSTSVFALWRKSEEEGDCSDIKDMDISLHSTVRLLQRSDTFVLVVSAASPACVCVRNNSQTPMSRISTFSDNLLVKYVWDGRSHFNNVHSNTCAPAVTCGRCVAPPTNLKRSASIKTAFAARLWKSSLTTASTSR